MASASWRIGAGLCDNDPQEPGLGIRCRCDSTDDPALHDAAAEPHLHRCDPRQAPGHPGRSTPGARHRRQGEADKATMVEAGRVARTAGASLFPPADRWTRPMTAMFGATQKGHPGPKWASPPHYSRHGRPADQVLAGRSQAISDHLAHLFPGMLRHDPPALRHWRVS